ncbi:hypothetical protein HMN09_01074500 [Mycena chlorophos]|uniref:Uncharacterized protein n=1 Tax=Mycena chlorophos TaxID=658473 RepID=A0A8H6VWQ0_MYCCL|nr:hypothetical protein HMN09_01074500 [Mycena chlorophos]
MALTQSARLPPGPSWDDEVVPALRKRLEGESRALTKRISAAMSISDLAEDVEPQPRPSYSSSNRKRSTDTAPKSKTRERTMSTPKLSEIPRPTRIPKPTRNGTGGGAQSPTLPTPTDSPLLNGRLLPPPTLTREPSQDTIHIPAIHRQTSGLLNEQPPFMPGPGSAKSHDEAPPRPSNDSEERPFEHWYRGEVSRNGGVGELRMGKRQEMLEIANYGHTLKQKQALAAASASTPPTDTFPRQRKRSESAAGLDRRESLYLDDEHADGVGRVLDEGPLTDVEMSDGDGHAAYYEEDRSTTPTPLRGPSRQATVAAQPMIRGMSEPPSVPTSSPSQGSRQLQNTSKRAATASPPSASTSKKPRANGTPTSTPRSNKSKATPPKAQRAKTVDNRRSIANYPSPGEGDEDMSHAIPTWTQPLVPSNGRWEDVVLPVVARKKGLDGYYSADGSPQQPKRDEQPIAPAAGTFGWDHTKYRPPRENGGADEFGRPMEDLQQDEPEYYAPQNPPHPLSAHERTPVGPQQPRLQQPSAPQQRAGSPLPFVDYRGPSVVDLNAEAAKLPPPQPIEQDEEGAGCCKCVVM